MVSLGSAIIGFTWINFIVEPDGILGGLPRAYKWVCEAMKVNCNDPIKDGIHEILFECEKCLSGQIALWIYLLTHGLKFEVVPVAFLAVFFAALINRIWVKYLL